MAAPATAAAPWRPAILLPAYNEEAAIGAVLAEIRAHAGYPVIVIDDCSSDATRRVAAAGGATVLPLATQLGAWGATQAGLRYARRQGYAPVITMDADGQHEAEHLATLLAPLEAGQANVVIGAFPERGSRPRRLAWRLMKLTSGITLADLTSGFRAYDREALRLLTGWRASLCSYQDIGVLALMQRAGLRITDVPVSMRPRSSGASRVFDSWLTVFYYMLHTLLLGLTKRPLRRRQRTSSIEPPV